MRARCLQFPSFNCCCTTPSTPTPLPCTPPICKCWQMYLVLWSHSYSHSCVVHVPINNQCRVGAGAATGVSWHSRLSVRHLPARAVCVSPNPCQVHVACRMLWHLGKCTTISSAFQHKARHRECAPIALCVVRIFWLRSVRYTSVTTTPLPRFLFLLTFLQNI